MRFGATFRGSERGEATLAPATAYELSRSQRIVGTRLQREPSVPQITYSRAISDASSVRVLTPTFG